MRIRIKETMWRRIHDGLIRRLDVESAAILVGRILDTSDGEILVAESAELIPDDGYLIRQIDRLSIDPLAINRMTKRARDSGMSILTVHTHPGAAVPWFSWADDRGDAKLMPSFHNQVTGPPHGSLVTTANDLVVARVFDDGAPPRHARLLSVGRRLVDHSPDADASVDDDRFDRQQLALGQTGQAQLRELRVAVVGAGGTGSFVGIELAHLGVGELVLLDGDVLDGPNLSRGVGSRKNDRNATTKVGSLARYIDEAQLPTRVIASPVHVTGEEQLRLLRTCDVIFSCVDRHTPRALLNRLAYDALVPVIDMGTVFRIGAAGGIESEGGRVVVVGPERPCLACWGHIHPERLRIEALSESARNDEAQVGYIEGATVAQPSVIAFNGMVASAAVIEFLRIVTGFAGAEDPPQRLGFSFTDGTVTRNRLSDARRCRICGSECP